jgi:hypothetical protein
MRDQRTVWPMGGLVVVEQQKNCLPLKPPRSHADTAESEEIAIIAERL